MTPYNRAMSFQVCRARRRIISRHATSGRRQTTPKNLSSVRSDMRGSMTGIGLTDYPKEFEFCTVRHAWLNDRNRSNRLPQRI